MRKRSDAVLMKAYARGDMVAFECLYERHRGPLYRYILRQVGDAATANDLYQGSWEKIIKARKSYSPSAPFQAWMYRIARNHVVDHFRQSRSFTELPAALESTNPGPDAALLNEQKTARLTAAIRQLPGEQREVLLLKLEAGLDLNTIAEITGVNLETAKSRLRYAVSRLKKEVGATPEGACS